MHRSTLTPLLLTLALLLPSPLLQAQQPQGPQRCESYVPPEEADKPNLLIMRGVQCFEAKRFNLAAEHYRAAAQQSESPLLLAAIGRSLHELGLYSLARAYYTAYMEKAKRDDNEGRDKIKERLQLLDSQVNSKSGVLELNVMPTKAETVLILESGHSEPLGEGRERLHLKPGTYRVVVNHPDYYSYDHTFTIEQGETEEVDAFLVREDALFDNTPLDWKRAGVYTMVASAPLIAASVTFLILGANANAQADDVSEPGRSLELQDQALFYRQLGTASGVAGVAVLISGIALYFIGVSQLEDLKNAPIKPVEDVKALGPLRNLELGVGALLLRF